MCATSSLYSLVFFILQPARSESLALLPHNNLAFPTTQSQVPIRNHAYSHYLHSRSADPNRGRLWALMSLKQSRRCPNHRQYSATELAAAWWTAWDSATPHQATPDPSKPGLMGGLRQPGVIKDNSSSCQWKHSHRGEVHMCQLWHSDISQCLLPAAPLTSSPVMHVIHNKLAGRLFFCSNLL